MNSVSHIQGWTHAMPQPSTLVPYHEFFCLETVTTCLRLAMARRPHYKGTVVSSLSGISEEVQPPEKQGAGKLSPKTLLCASVSAQC